MFLKYLWCSKPRKRNFCRAFRKFNDRHSELPFNNGNIPIINLVMSIPHVILISRLFVELWRKDLISVLWRSLEDNYVAGQALFWRRWSWRTQKGQNLCMKLEESFCSMRQGRFQVILLGSLFFQTTEQDLFSKVKSHKASSFNVWGRLIYSQWKSRGT